MHHHLAIDPALDLAADELASSWNNSDNAEQAAARVESASASSFPMSEMTVILLSAAASIPAAVIATFISDYLKQKFSGSKPPAVEVTTISTPDGEPLFIIRKSIDQNQS